MSEAQFVEELPEVTIWTDGSCHVQSGKGGYAALLRFGANEKPIGDHLLHTTSQRAELIAAIEALKQLKTRCSVTIFSDSNYLIRGSTEWAPRWIERGELHIRANNDLWSELLCLLEDHEVYFQKVTGHAGVHENELVDKLAGLASRGVKIDADLVERIRPTRTGEELMDVLVPLPDEITWPPASELEYKKFGREVARLYPFLQHEPGEEVPKVMTSHGPGTVKQAFTGGVKVVLDNPPPVVYPSRGKPFTPMVELPVREVWPLEENIGERELGGDESGLPHLRGDRQELQADGGHPVGDEVVQEGRGVGEVEGAGGQARKPRRQPANAKREAQLSLI